MEVSRLNHERQSFILLINVKMPTIIGISTFNEQENFMFSTVEQEKGFITSRGLAYPYVN